MLDVYSRIRKRSSVHEYWRVWCMLYRKSAGRSLHAKVMEGKSQTGGKSQNRGENLASLTVHLLTGRQDLLVLKQVKSCHSNLLRPYHSNAPVQSHWTLTHSFYP